MVNLKETTHIRVPKDVKERLNALVMPGETMGTAIARLIDGYENCLDSTLNSNKKDNLLPGISPKEVSAEEVIRNLQNRISMVEEQSRIALDTISRHEKNFGMIFPQIVEMQSREKNTLQDLDDFEDGLKRLHTRIERLEISQLPLEDVSSEIQEHVVYEISPESFILIPSPDDDVTIPHRKIGDGTPEDYLHTREKKKGDHPDPDS